MADNEIILFDIPSKPPRRTWSYNTWRTRLLLSYKGLKYRTEWLEYPNIRTRLEGHVPDNGSDTPYTVPTILLPDGTYVMHSLKILEAINKRYPSPPLKYQTPRLDRFMKCVEQTMIAFRGIYVPGVANRLLGEGSLDFFHRTRERDIGMTLAEFEEKEGGEGAYEAMEQHLKQVTALLAEDGGGPFFEGKDVSQIDFVWIGILLFIQRMGDDVFDKVLRRSGDAKKHLDLLEAAKPWYEKDD